MEEAPLKARKKARHTAPRKGSAHGSEKGAVYGSGEGRGLRLKRLAHGARLKWNVAAYGLAEWARRAAQEDCSRRAAQMEGGGSWLGRRARLTARGRGAAHGSVEGARLTARRKARLTARRKARLILNPSHERSPSVEP